MIEYDTGMYLYLYKTSPNFIFSTSGMKIKNLTYPQILLIVFAVIWVLLAINPNYRFDWFLENILVFAWIPLLIHWHSKQIFSNASYTLIFIFLVLHVIGSHYTYAEVPFGNLLPFYRNHYDRVVHFLFGILIFLPALELFDYLLHPKTFWKYYLPFTLLLCLGSLYELIEWLAAIVVDPQAGIAFLGSQGDVFDAQKDFGYNILGALIALIFCYFILERNTDYTD